MNKTAAIGGFVRDEDGRILLAYQGYLGTSSILEAELQGRWYGLQMCKRENYLQVQVESDSLVAIKAITPA